MLKLEKKQVKIISIAIALVFIGSVVALALTSTGSGVASAASSVNVGVVDTNQIFAQHPDLQKAEDQLRAFASEVEKDFNERTAGMETDQEKQDYYMQCQRRIQEKQQELLEPLRKSVEDTIKKVADSKGLSVVIDKAAVVYGGNDITQDVISRLNKK